MPSPPTYKLIYTLIHLICDVNLISNLNVNMSELMIDYSQYLYIYLKMYTIFLSHYEYQLFHPASNAWSKVSGLIQFSSLFLCSEDNLFLSGKRLNTKRILRYVERILTTIMTTFSNEIYFSYKKDFFIYVAIIVLRKTYNSIKLLGFNT